MVNKIDQIINVFDEQKIRKNEALISCSGVNVFYSDKQALFDVNLDIKEKLKLCYSKWEWRVRLTANW